MNWFKENPFLAGLIGVTVVIAGALGYLLMQEMTRYQEATDGYSQAVAKLHGLQERAPFPNQKNLETARAQSSEYKKSLEDVRQQLAGMELPLNSSIRPQQFQDDLRTAVNETAAKAQQAGVALPANFYLGFSQYANNLPSEKAAPHLARQLVLIKQLVQQLIDFKIKSLDSLDRTPLPQENPNAATAESAAPQRQAQGRPGRAAGNSDRDAEKVFERYPFDLAFTAEQSKLRVAFNALLNGKDFLIVRALEVQNTSPAGPLVGGGEAAGGAPQAPGGMVTGGQEPARALNVILGQELVRAALRIDILDFPDVEEKAN